MPEGDPEPASDLLPQVYDQLRKAAQKHMGAERAGHTLSATALVHEAFLKLHDPETPWQNRAHFYAAAAEAMRHILLDHARSRARLKRGGGIPRINLDTAAITLEEPHSSAPSGAGVPPASSSSFDFLALDDAIRRLEERDPRAASVVRLRFYAGLEIA